MKCPKCNQEMENLGNLSGMVYTSNPVQWDNVYICRKDKVKKTVRVHANSPPDYSFVDNYEEVKEQKG